VTCLPGILQLKTAKTSGIVAASHYGGIIVPFLKNHHLAWRGFSSVSYMFHSGYVEKQRKMQMKREKKARINLSKNSPMLCGGEIGLVGKF